MVGLKEPYEVREFDVLAQKLAVGEWFVQRHETLGDLDLGTWKVDVRLAASDVGVVPEIFDVPRKNLTVVWNPAMEPAENLVKASIARAEYDRVMDNHLGTELEVKKNQQ